MLSPRRPRWSIFVGALAAVLAASGSLLHLVVRASDGNASTNGGRAARPLLAEPALSPDGSEIAFVSGGDIWVVPASGGAAHLLVADPAYDSRPIYSPDGRRLAFQSTRAGQSDVYVLTLDGGDVRRLTFDDAAEALDAWSPDGRYVYFSSASHDLSRMNDLYRVDADGGTPLPLSRERYLNEWTAAPAPDGRRLAFTARGIGQWWRKGSSHIDQSALWLMEDGEPPRYERLTDGEARELWPMWAPDGRTLYFVSDRGGVQNVWVRPAEGALRRVTSFKDGRVLWPSISRDGRSIVFERDMGIWLLDAKSGEVRPVAVTLRGAAARRPTEHLSMGSRFSDLALSPDGKKVAFVARGEVFAGSAKDGGDAERVTRTPAPESDLAWSPDSNRLAYASERDGAPRLYLYDFLKKTERALSAGGGDSGPRFSPDGKEVAFLRDGRELRVAKVDAGDERVIATGHFDRAPFVNRRDACWSPDGRFLAYFSVGDRMFSNVWVAPAGGGAAQAVSFLANVGGSAISWSPDGTFLLFTTGQRTENGQLARVDLLPRVPRFREDQFRELFREETPPVLTPPGRRPASPAPAEPPPASSPSVAPSPAPSASPDPESEREHEAKKPIKPVEIVYEGIRQRLSLLPVGVDAADQAISPDGKWVVMIASAAGQANLWLYSLDELSRDEPVARQITATPSGKADVVFSPDSKEIFYLDAGRISIVPVEGRPRPLPVTAEMDVDFDREKGQVFTQAWTYLRDHFHDGKFHGVDWEAVRESYAPRVEAARMPDELRRILNLMVGELDASHMGVNAPGDGNSPVTGRLGLSFDRAEYEKSGRLRITEVLPRGPADVTRAVKPGDELLAVEGVPLGRHDNLDERLAHRIGHRTTITVAGSGALSGSGAPREVVVRPMNQQTEKGLLYRAWVEGRRQYVHDKSGGRLGYVHMLDMGMASLAQLSLDLDAENVTRQGVVVDVRNNNGGFVNVYAIDVLARKEYLTMTQRGMPSGPARTVLGQRALERPTILVTNQDSLSDAEDFTEGYRSLGLGKVVGEPTAGWIIYTWNQTLVDGSVLRMPRMTVRSAAGEEMEGHPRPVDVPVERALDESAAGHDRQLDVAVRELLAQIDRR